MPATRTNGAHRSALRCACKDSQCRGIAEPCLRGCRLVVEEVGDRGRASLGDVHEDKVSGSVDEFESRGGDPAGEEAGVTGGTVGSAVPEMIMVGAVMRCSRGRLVHPAAAASCPR